VKADTLVIVNPAAGAGSALRNRRVLANYFAAQQRAIEFLEVHTSEDLRRLAARAAADGFRFVLALGGDGTVHDLIEGLLGSSVTAGILPSGNGNDIARSLGIPLDPVRAADAFLHSRARAIDVLRVQFARTATGHIVGAGGAGLDAEAAHRANTIFKKWPGVTRYLAGAFGAFFDGASFEMTAEIDGAHWSGRALLAVVANGTYYGSGVRIAPDASLDDGFLDVLLVRDLPWTRFVEAIPILLTSGDLRFAEIERFRCQRLLLETDRPVKVHGDGELLGESPAEFAIMPKAIRVALPRWVETQI
jgi:diacylglycerol kinase (ATP)